MGNVGCYSSEKDNALNVLDVGAILYSSRRWTVMDPAAPEPNVYELFDVFFPESENKKYTPKLSNTAKSMLHFMKTVGLLPTIVEDVWEKQLKSLFNWRHECLLQTRLEKGDAFVSELHYLRSH